VSVRLRHLAADDRGFSLTELLVAMVLASIVGVTVLTIFTQGLGATTGVQNRVEANQKGRLALDAVGGLLDSQVCLLANDPANAGQVKSMPPILATDPFGKVTNGNSVSFYATLNGGNGTPDLYRITYDPAAKTLTQYRYAGQGTEPSVTFNPTPKTRVLATNILPAGFRKSDGTTTTLPIFSYYTFQADGTVRTDPDPAQDTALPAAPLSALNAAKVVRVWVRMVPAADRAKTVTASNTLQTQSTLATARPPAPPDDPGAVCP
jgi:prepilin-type N-terminal cleavage/methylation domain-containing protein